MLILIHTDLDRLLQLLEHGLDGLDLADHEVVADLQHEVVHLQVLLLLPRHGRAQHALVTREVIKNKALRHELSPGS